MLCRCRSGGLRGTFPRLIFAGVSYCVCMCVLVNMRPPLDSMP